MDVLRGSARAAGLLAFFLAAACHGQTNLPIHSLHAAKLGRLDCNLCHLPAAKGSVDLRRPGHAQCMLCHAAAFRKQVVATICAQCHQPAAQGDPAALERYPSRQRVLAGFSHDRHADPKARFDRATGIRADCAFCHKLAADGWRQRIPGHAQCSACHSKPGMRPELNAFVRTADCRGCHAPEQLEQPSVAAEKRHLPITFSHAAHRVDCVTCHAKDSQRPRMADCAGCHESSRRIPAALRMSRCATCHQDSAQPGGAMVTSFNRTVRPESHTGAFRVHHEDAASASGASCFACHQNVVASASARNQCTSCHMTMRPASHTARWKDDIHGKYAALDRSTCATCHASESCSRCHNELPRSHVPLPVFKAGGHAGPAMMNTRACFTCHTFQNTCATCHVNSLRPGSLRQ